MYECPSYSGRWHIGHLPEPVIRGEIGRESLVQSRKSEQYRDARERGAMAMGYEYRTLSITASVSRHNSARDEADDRLWDDLVKRVEEIVNDEKYRQITPMT